MLMLKKINQIKCLALQKKEKNESYQKIPATIQKNCHGGDDGAEGDGDCHPKWPKLAQR